MELDKEELEATRNRKKKICKNCKFFERINNCKFYGECNNPKMEYETGLGYEQKQKENNKKIEKDKLFYMDYEWYNADIEVGEEFGCIHFENKD